MVSASDRPSQSTQRVLVVDDDHDVREVISDVLKDVGFSVLQASNGQLALEVMRAFPEPALVVLDLDMPVMSGAELLAHMKTDGRLSLVPVLILSGTNKSKAPQDESVVGFVSKPCDLNGFVRTVTAHLRRRGDVLASGPPRP
jgi:two-component system, response regulator, stage 0 sporulation protein F